MESFGGSINNHFAFGDNWADFSKGVTSTHVDFAVVELQNLFQCEGFRNLTWCDLGSGSGIHAVAAALLGARVLAVDIDTSSCQTTHQLAERFGCIDKIEVKQASVLDLPRSIGQFDVVYSWGVLHHTGSLWAALDSALDLVSPESGSRIALALYRQTRLCNAWRIEKEFYAHTHPRIQRSMRAGTRRPTQPACT